MLQINLKPSVSAADQQQQPNKVSPLSDAANASHLAAGVVVAVGPVQVGAGDASQDVKHLDYIEPSQTRILSPRCRRGGRSWTSPGRRRGSGRTRAPARAPLPRPPRAASPRGCGRSPPAQTKQDDRIGAVATRAVAFQVSCGRLAVPSTQALRAAALVQHFVLLHGLVHTPGSADRTQRTPSGGRKPPPTSASQDSTLKKSFPTSQPACRYQRR